MDSNLDCGYHYRSRFVILTKFIPTEYISLSKNAGLLFLVFGYIGGFLNPKIYPWFLRLPFVRKYAAKANRLESISPKDLLTIDATMIVGALVLLSLYSINDELSLPGSGLSCLTGMTSAELIGNTTATVVVLFAFSAIATMAINDIKRGSRLMIGAFVYLFFAIISLTYIPDLSSIPIMQDFIYCPR